MKKKLKNERRKSNKRLLIILISVFLGAVVCFGAVFGIIAAAKSGRAVMKYKGTYVSPGVANYLAATHKTHFIASLGIEVFDSPEFWASQCKDGRTYGELLAEDTERYIREVVAGSYIFDRYTSLTSSEKKAIKNAVKSRIDYLFDGDMDEFSRVAATMGFDYADFLEATKMLYKHKNAKAAIFGSDGSNLLGAYADCDKYYEKYSHVKLLFIRTESEFATDENGNRVVGPDGKDKVDPLNSTEREKRLKDIADIDAAILALENGENFQMSAEYFDSFLKKYSYDTEFDMGGYYFAPNSEYTALFYEKIDGKASYADIADAALKAEIGDFVKVEYEDGICYVYKYEREQYAYGKDRYAEFFEDFYSDAADYLYPELLSSIAQEVTVKDRFYAVDPIYMPYNTYIIASVEL